MGVSVSAYNDHVTSTHHPLAARFGARVFDQRSQYDDRSFALIFYFSWSLLSLQHNR